MPEVKLCSSDGVVFVVDFEVVKNIGRIKNTVNDEGSCIDFDKVINIPRTKAPMVEKMIEWAKNHHEDLKQDAKTVNYAPGSWEEKFFQVDLQTLFDYMVIAYFHGMRDLELLAAKYFLNVTKGKSLEEIDEMLHPEKYLVEEKLEVSGEILV